MHSSKLKSVTDKSIVEHAGLKRIAEYFDAPDLTQISDEMIRRAKQRGRRQRRIDDMTVLCDAKLMMDKIHPELEEA